MPMILRRTEKLISNGGFDLPDSRLCIYSDLMTATEIKGAFARRDLLGIDRLSVSEITYLLDLSDSYVEQNRQIDKKTSVLRGRTQINLFLKAQHERKALLSWPVNVLVPM